MKEQTLYLLRHGISEASLRHVYSGRGDTPLADSGREELRERRYPPVERYISSPSRRAVETLQILYGPVEIELCPALMECDFGEFEGHTYEQMKNRPEYQTWILDESGDAAPPGGESRNAHARRVRAGMERLLAEEFTSAAVVCHGGSIVWLMEGWFPGQRNFYEWQPACGEGWKVTLRAGKPVGCEAIDGRTEDV